MANHSKDLGKKSLSDLPVIMQQLCRARTLLMT